MFPSDYFKIGKQYDLPPTLFKILKSFLVNENKENDVSIVNLAKETHSHIFNFTYPLSNNINKDEFEIMILNKFLQRRIAYETITAFQIQLNVKLNEIMPSFNKLIDAIQEWNIFKDGEITSRILTDKNILDKRINNAQDSLNNATSTDDNRFSDTPQNNINDVKNGSYITTYNYNTNTNNNRSNVTIEGTENSTDNRDINEVIYKSVNNKIDVYSKYIQELNSIYTMIFKELDCLFFAYIDF